MISALPLHCRPLFVVAAVVAGLGIAGSTHTALARVPTAPVMSPVDAAPSQGADRAIVVADNDDDDHGHKNGKKHGNNDHDGNKNGDNRNWNGNGQNWNGNKNWNKNGQNWSGNNNHNRNRNHDGNWNKNWSKNNHWDDDDWGRGAYVRGWSRKPYYGDFFGGVVLGSILAATGVGIVPYSPDPNLCWYWADPYMYRGYWDYCY